MATLILKSGTTAIAGAVVKGSFSYFSGNTTKDLGPSSLTGFYSGVDAPSGGYTVYQTGGPSGFNIRVATGTTDLNIILIQAGATGSTLDQRITWATNTGSMFINSGTSASSSVLIGYYSNPGTFINNCAAACTGVTTTLPLYVSNSVSGVTYTLSQLVSSNIYATGSGPNIFYTNSNLTTPLPAPGGTVYGFSPTSGGTPYRQFRIGTSTTYTGWGRCGAVVANGYMVQSSTLVNVGNSQRDYIVPDDTSAPYVGKEIYSSSGTAGFTVGTTWAWASQPNVIATNLITFSSTQNTCLQSVT